MKKLRKEYIVAIIALFAAMFALNTSVPTGNVAAGDGCGTVVEYTVRGNSMAGLLEDGQEISVNMGYYGCNEIKAGDIVLYNYTGSDATVIKTVKGVQGDSLAVKDGSIIVNGETTQNSEGQPYKISDRGVRMLSLYINDYGGKIPPGAVLLLGNLPDGTTDSTVFGLVDVSDILGKAV